MNRPVGRSLDRSNEPLLRHEAEDLPGLRVGDVSRWLAGNTALRAPMRFSRIGRGRSNLTYSVIDPDGQRLVLRRPPLGTLLQSAHDVERECRVLSALAGQAVSVPAALGMCTDVEVTGGPFYVMEHVDGLVIDTASRAAELGPAARGACGPALARALAGLHSVKADQIGLRDLGRREDYAQRQLRRWGRRWAEVATRALPQIDAVAEALGARIPVQREAGLVHGVFNLANTIVSPAGEIAAVLDWELCTLGDPVADLGTLLCYWPDTPDQVVPDRDPVPLLEGFSSRSEIVSVYTQACPERDLSALGFWLTLATWKLAIILEGVRRRNLENAANGGAGTERLGQGVTRMAELAAQLSEQDLAI